MKEVCGSPDVMGRQGMVGKDRHTWVEGGNVCVSVCVCVLVCVCVSVCVCWCACMLVCV